jgi:hypothetical protein
MRASLGAHILDLREAFPESPSDSINTVDQNLLLAAPDDDTFNDLVQTGEPVCRCYQRLEVSVVRCGAWNWSVGVVDRELRGIRYLGKRQPIGLRLLRRLRRCLRYA